MNKTIKAGQTLTARSMCDYDSIFTASVLKRTEKTATVKFQGNTKTCKIRKDTDGNEYIRPENYSMAPIFRA